MPEPFDSLIVPTIVLAFMVGNHFWRARARRSAIAIVETGGAKSFRLAGETIATLLWLGGSFMCLFAVGFIRSDEPIASLVQVLAFFGLLPVTVSALIYGAADRHLRPWYRTMAYVYLWWSLVVAYLVGGFFLRR